MEVAKASFWVRRIVPLLLTLNAIFYETAECRNEEITGGMDPFDVFGDALKDEGLGGWAPNYFLKPQPLYSDDFGGEATAGLTNALDYELMPVSYYLTRDDGAEDEYARGEKMRTFVPPLPLSAITAEAADLVSEKLSSELVLRERPDGLPLIGFYFVYAYGFEVHVTLNSRKAAWSHAIVGGNSGVNSLRRLFGRLGWERLWRVVRAQINRRITDAFSASFLPEAKNFIRRYGVQVPVRLRISLAFPWIERAEDLPNPERTLFRAVRVVFLSTAVILPTSGLQAIMRDSRNEAGIEGIDFLKRRDIVRRASSGEIFLVGGQPEPWSDYKAVFVHGPVIDLSQPLRYPPLNSPSRSDLHALSVRIVARLAGDQPQQSKLHRKMRDRLEQTIYGAVKWRSLMGKGTEFAAKLKQIKFERLTFGCKISQLTNWKTPSNRGAHRFCVHLPIAPHFFLPQEIARVYTGQYPVRTEAVYIVVENTGNGEFVKRWVTRTCMTTGWSEVRWLSASRGETLYSECSAQMDVDTRQFD